MTREEREARDVAERERFRMRVEARIQAWFMSPDGGCDFWSECDAPYQLSEAVLDEIEAMMKEKL
jgi:hypothetical protein